MKSSRRLDASYSFIKNLSLMLTPQQVFKFVEKTAPELRLGQSSLEQSLDSQQWEVAAQQAHQLKSAISLFSADSLVNSLDAIEAGNEAIQLPAFKDNLGVQCQELIDNLDNYLANN